MKNTLAGSGSPYLHQHANQPVAWQQWARDTHELARRTDRPLFLSVGYATCHWCHVMAHESFEDERVAELLNTYFVPVKIDREERPDVDQFYMTACQASGRQGGWPLTVIALPDGRPFYVATYLPRDSTPRQAGLIELLQRVAHVWKERRSHVEEATDQLHRALEGTRLTSGSADTLGADRSASAVRGMHEALPEAFDEKHGGFGTAPKFPSWHHLVFLLRTDQNGQAIAATSLAAMRAGGIWDHVGGGFHRYSTDRRWRLPHFEKMLYDQAWALRTYAEAFAATGNPLFGETANELVDALERDFRAEDYLYHAAWDADSEGEEGRYYTWTWEELGRVLGESGRERLHAAFDVDREGNFLDEATHRQSGRNVLCAKDPSLISGVVDELAQLQTARRQRVPPLCDTKRLADWNGLTLSALAAAARYTGSSKAFDAAIRLGKAAWATFMESGTLKRSSFDGSTRFAGQLDDYAFLAEGYIHLSEISGQADDLDRARRLLYEAREQLHDPITGDWYVSAETDVPLRMTRYHDEAYASGASVLLRCMEILDRMYRDDGWQEVAQGLRSLMVSAAEAYPLACTGTGAVLLENLAPRGEMTVQAADGDVLSTAAKRLFAPNLFLITGSMGGRAPYVPESVPSSAHVQICTGTVCHAPIQHVDALKNWMLSVYSDPSIQSDRT